MFRRSGRRIVAFGRFYEAWFRGKEFGGHDSIDFYTGAMQCNVYGLRPSSLRAARLVLSTYTFFPRAEIELKSLPGVLIPRPACFL